MENKLEKEWVPSTVIIESLHAEIESLLKTQKIMCKFMCPDADESCANYHCMEDIINALSGLEIEIDILMRKVNVKTIEFERDNDD